MERTSLYKSKLQMIIYTIIFIICLSLCVIIGTKDYSKEKEKDNIRFNNLYNKVDINNVYKFVNASEVYNIINGNSGIILMTFPMNKWSNKYASIINEVALETGISNIYYYDFLNDRENNNGTYEAIVNKLSNYILFDDLDNKDILAPTLIIVKNGIILNFFDDVSYHKGNLNPDNYFTNYEINRIKEEIGEAFLDFKK